jgi:hypothetical protein
VKVEGTIVAPDEVSAWGKVSSPTWLVFEHVTNFSISGTGTFNGQGKNWWACKKAKTMVCLEMICRQLRFTMAPMLRWKM